jgi:hypothetical protein
VLFPVVPRSGNAASLNSQTAVGLGYTPVALLRMGHWELSNFRDTVGMLPGHKATFLQDFPGLQSFILENDRMFEHFYYSSSLSLSSRTTLRARSRKGLTPVMTIGL